MQNLQCTYLMVGAEVPTIELDRRLVTVEPWMLRTTSWLRALGRSCRGRRPQVAASASTLFAMPHAQAAHPGLDLGRWSR